MTTRGSLADLLHRATHRVPGVPAHAERRPGATPRLSLNHRWNHSPARPPRFLPGWQHRIATLFTRES
ncbi:hypothetical protein [Actinoplanes flavus]|uniref:Uncharacterized protein n=1 Tax=Actinoplanes flavus TaxID=2820290 RepID=A0ABS3UTI2_9ACTN|nr:hypothetical protein [Actinoplanes flavus]MBO3741881.1 hypothetical protein [Actinoplanes flavus]